MLFEPVDSHYPTTRLSMTFKIIHIAKKKLAQQVLASAR
jgi:hypothetical protein